MVERCKATNASGAPCGAQARRDGWCAWHDPARRAEMAEARRRGGQARSNKARARKQLTSAAMSPAELQGVIGLTITQVLAGTKPPGVGQAVAALARAAMHVREASEVEARLEALEAALEQTGRGRGFG
jgi:hypothetical protein